MIYVIIIVNLLKNKKKEKKKKRGSYSSVYVEGNCGGVKPGPTRWA